MASKHPSYLRSHRRRAGLTQADVAALLAFRTKAAISRYERAGRLPPLEAALAFEAMFGVPVANLFPQAVAESKRRLRERARNLRERLQPAGTPAVFARRQRSIDNLATSE